MIQLIANGVVLNEKGGIPLKYIPAIGSKVLYKTFRENRSMTAPVYDILYIVDDVIYETQESWHNNYDSLVNVYVTEIQRTQVR